MKRFALLFVIVAAVLLALPAVVGYQVEQRYQQWQQELQQGGVELGRKSYRRNWFGATADTVLRITLPADAQGKSGTLELTVSSEIRHGPLTWGSGLGLAEIESRVQIDGRPLFPEQNPERLLTRVGLDGSGATQVVLPPLDMEARDDLPEIHFEGLTGGVEFSAGLDRITSRFSMPMLSLVTAAGQRISFSGVELESRSRRDDNGLMLGDGRFVIGGFSLDDPGGDNRIELQGLEISGVSDSQADLVSGQVSYRLQRLDMNGSRFGPGLLTLGLDQLSASALKQIQQGMEQIRRKALPEREQSRQVLGVMLANLEPLLTRNPKLTIDPLTLQAPEGEIKARFSIQPKGLQRQEVANLQALLQKLDGVFELSMPEVYYQMLFRQQAKRALQQQLAWRRLQDEQATMPTPDELEAMAERLGRQQLDQLLRQEMLRREGKMLYTKASLADGLLTVNGKLLPLPIMSPAG